MRLRVTPRSRSTLAAALVVSLSTGVLTGTVAAHQPAAPVVTVDAVPETATSVNGIAHSVTVVIRSDGAAVEGVVPKGVILPDATGRPAGDVADELAGPSPNYAPGSGQAYACSPTDAAGTATCTFQDPLGTGAGTDTIVFFVDAGGDPNAPEPNDPQDAVQKTWTASVTARNIRLCHGDAPATHCETAQQTSEAGDSDPLSARVTDARGRPVGGIPVELRESGPGVFVSTRADSVVVVTNSSGIASTAVTADADGDSTFVAEISPQGLSGGFRGPGPADDECEQPAGPGGSPSAGNCISAPLTTTWIDEDFVAICEDRLDNDGDGYVDMEDPSCTSPEDDTEAPQDPPPFEHPMFRRQVNLHFDHAGGPRSDRLVLSGRVKVVDGDTAHPCVGGQPVSLQRRVDGQWREQVTVSTNEWGRYRAVVKDVVGRYRADAPKTEVPLGDSGFFYICRPTGKHKPHRHRR